MEVIKQKKFKRLINSSEIIVNEDNIFNFTKYCKIVQELENNLSERNQEVKPFSCKFCDKSFAQVHEVKEHIKIHASILIYNDGTTNSTD